jgi:hypothetical protein
MCRRSGSVPDPDPQHCSDVCCAGVPVGVEEAAAESAAQRRAGSLPSPRPQLHHHRQQGLPIRRPRQRLGGSFTGGKRGCGSRIYLYMDLDPDQCCGTVTIFLRFWFRFRLLKIYGSGPVPTFDKLRFRFRLLFGGLANDSEVRLIWGRGKCGCGSGSELDPDSIGSLDPDPGGQKLPRKSREKIKKFHVLKCWMSSFDSGRLL